MRFKSIPARSVAFILSASLISVCAVTGGGVYGAAGEVYKYCDNDGKRIALTFDDGPHCKYTARILDILSEYGVRATFFMIGVNCECYPEIVAQVTAEGHEIGNHTYTHNKTWTMGRDALLREMRKASDVISEACGVAPCLFRPPAGVSNPAVVYAAVKMNYSVILWTVDPRDWDEKTTLTSAVNNVISNVRSGSIILCHDYVSRGDSITPDMIAIIIPLLLEEGYSFVTVSELISGHD